MKKMKHLISALLVAIMVVAMAIPSMAAGSYTITINDEMDGHTYEAYQIFSGDLSSSGDTLSSIVWGDGVTAAGQAALIPVYDALAKDEDPSASVTDAADIAEFLTSEAKAAAFAENVAAYLDTTKAHVSVVSGPDVYKITNLPAGYYLVKDQDDSLSGVKDDAYTAYILRVVADRTVVTKADNSKVEKFVNDINDSTASGYEGYKSSADYDIGDEIPFQLKATLASTVGSYDAYKVVFHDTLSAGLTYNNNAVVKVDGVDKTANFTITHSAGVLTISCDDVKEAAVGASGGSVITVDYTATLNDSAVVGMDGNKNTVYLEYSNNPNSTETGITTEDYTTVYTYKFVINKTDKNDVALDGATFELQKYVYDAVHGHGSWKTLTTIASTPGDPLNTFTFTGLDDGEYRLIETVAPDGYNKMDPVDFTIKAEHSETGIASLTGSKVTGEISFTADTDAGSLTSQIVNYKGFELPTTGGMGTTIFYVVGAACVIGVGVLLVTRRRANAER